MPFVLDGLNMIFLAAAAIFGGTIIKANPDLTCLLYTSDAADE